MLLLLYENREKENDMNQLVRCKDNIRVFLLWMEEKMRTLQLLTLTFLLLNGILCLGAVVDPTLDGYVYTVADYAIDIQVSSSIFLCSDNSVVVFSIAEWDDAGPSYKRMITKLDPLGHLLWRRQVPGGAYPIITGVDIDGADNVTFIHTDGDLCKLCTVSSDGVISDLSEPVQLPRAPFFTKAMRTGSGDIVAVGSAIWADDYINPSYCTTYCHFSALGDTLATANWYNSQHDSPMAHDLAFLDNGNLLITGAFGAEDSTILEINLAGEVLNSCSIPPTNYDLYGVTISKEANAQSHLVAYGTDGGVSIGRFSGGNLQHLFSIPTTTISYVSSMIVTPENIFICGASGPDGRLVKLDWAGNVLWTRKQRGWNLCEYVVYGGGMSKSLLALDQYGCVYWAWGRANQLVVVKLLPDGEVPVQDEVQTPAVNALTAYPNPMKSHLTIKSASALRDDGVNVYNIRGELVCSLKLSDGEAIWDGKDRSGHNCPSGVYLLRSTSDRNQVTKISKIN